MKFKKIVFIFSLFFFFFEILGQSFFYIKNGISFYKHKELTFFSFAPKINILNLGMYNPNELAVLSGYPSDLMTDRYGNIHNGFDKEIVNQNFNIFFVGGSTVEGRGSSSNQTTIPAYLEKIFNDEFAPFFLNKKVHVINMGFSGDTSFQEQLRIFGIIMPNYKPDLIISLTGRNNAHNLISRGTDYKINIDNLSFQYQLKFINEFKKDCIICALNFKLKSISIVYEKINSLFISLEKKIFIENKSNELKYLYDLGYENLSFKSSAQGFYSNIMTTNFYLNILDVPYFSFLQPTLTNEFKNHITNQEKEFVNKFKKNLSFYDYSVENYYKSINKFYKEANKLLSKTDINYLNLSYLFENIKETTYWDTVHYNDLGNYQIASAIANFITSKNFEKNKK